ncbi:MAG: transglycosylase domain-containing protein [Thermoanaerobaculia bacterium]
MIVDLRRMPSPRVLRRSPCRWRGCSSSPARRAGSARSPRRSSPWSSKTLSKQQILALYCNLVFLGHNNYGMESAARSYFGHGVRDLSLPEAATLAGIVQRPSSYSPYRHPDRVVARRDYVLRRMFEEGWISDEELRDALATPLTVVHQKQRSELGPYFAEEVRQHLERQYGEDRLYHEGSRSTRRWTPRSRTAPSPRSRRAPAPRPPARLPCSPVARPGRRSRR